MEAVQNEVSDILKNRRFEIVVDQSGSMDRPAASGSPLSRWRSVAETSETVCRKFQSIAQEIFLSTFNSTYTRYKGVTPESIAEIFRKQEPNGSTALDRVLHNVFDSYITDRNNGKAPTNGLYVICFTDGQPDNQEAVAKGITNFTHQLKNPKEAELTFVQVGDEAGAADYLRRLDDDLESAGAKYDIVDVITHDKFGGKSILDVVTQALLEHKQSA